MSTIIRPELSERNKYYIEKHRYYELKHFCLQYPIWKEAYVSLDGLSKRPSDLNTFASYKESPTEKCALAKDYYTNRIKMIEQACNETDAGISQYILLGVTEGFSYDILRVRYDIPCCRDYYYKAYRRFFSVLNKIRE